MHDFARRMLSLDRRLIFLLVGVVTLLPLLYPVGLPIRVSPEVRKVYDYMESLPEGAVLLLSLDFDPASKPELYPMSVALLRHAFRKHLKVLGLTLWVTGTAWLSRPLPGSARERQRKGEGLRVSGYAPGEANAIISMGQDFYAAFPADYYGAKTADLPVLKDVHTLRDVQYAIS